MIDRGRASRGARIPLLLDPGGDRLRALWIASVEVLQRRASRLLQNDKEG